ncbi:hypothetical protein [Nocardia asteroides]|uniref:hypothetical protein n=1 Tax=Nocardia asteroides TaxID=1824 RepID=UPI001E3F8A97|nr:hypothetical protein [Nocardia asteroides]UGT63410.1 hypothetical protein LTT61_08890 [Nocardia asteroides]
MTYVSTVVDGYDGLEVRYSPERVYQYKYSGDEELLPATVLVDLLGCAQRSYLSLSITDARSLLDQLSTVLAEHDAAESTQTDTTVDTVDAGKAA